MDPLRDNLPAFVCRKNADKKRKHRSLDLPDGSGWGDHIQLLQIFELWDQENYDVNWCKDRELQASLNSPFLKHIHARHYL